MLKGTIFTCVDVKKEFLGRNEDFLSFFFVAKRLVEALELVGFNN